SPWNPTRPSEGPLGPGGSLRFPWGRGERAAFSAGGDGGRTSPEFPAQFYTRFLVRLSQCHRGVLISHSQYKLGGNALHTIRKQGGVTYQLGGEPKCGLSQRR